MLTRLKGWIVPVLLLGTLGYAIAEEITLTTYYPSPRGVYDQLRTAGNVQFGRIDPPDPLGPPPPRVHIYRERDDTTNPPNDTPLLLVEDQRPNGGADPDATPFIIDEQGNVGIGTTGDPSTGLSAKLEVAGQVRFDNGDLCLGGVCRTNWPSYQMFSGTNPSCPAGQPISRNWLPASFSVSCGVDPGTSCPIISGFGGLYPSFGSATYCCPAGCHPCEPAVGDSMRAAVDSGTWGSWDSVFCLE